MVLLKRKTRLKSGLLIWLTVVNLLVGTTYTWNSYQRQKAALLDGIDHQLRAAAYALTRLLPPDFHDRAAQGLISAEEHLEVTKLLSNYAEDAGVFYIYSFIVDPTGNFSTASTSASEQDWIEGSIPDVGDAYAAPPASQAVMSSGVAGAVEDTDEFGQWRSFLVPLQTSTGLSYLAGADVEIGHVHALLVASLRDSVLIGLTGFLLASIFTYWISSLVSRDLLRVVDDTGRIARFQLDGETAAGSAIVEVDQLMRSVEDMKSGLRSFRKYVPADLVREVLLSGQEARLGGHAAELSVLFSDIADFTSLSERLTPEELVAHVGEYLGAMSDAISEAHGTVDKYIGDAIMAFWGAPSHNPSHALDACRSALRCAERLRQLNARWAEQGRPILQTRTGIHAGALIVGNLGSENRLDYTVMGDTVNVASRIEGLNRFYRTSILITDQLRQLAGDAVIARPVDRVAVKGRSEGLLVLELLGLCDAANEAILSLADAGTKLWDAYQSAAWDEALSLADNLLAQHPSDGPARILRERCQAFLVSPPPTDWNGIWQMTEK